MSNLISIHEPSRDIPVSGEFDVVVVGGGVAGVAAAVAAARNSARVCLVERYCSLGGLATLGNVTIWLPLCDGRGNQVIAGLGEELLKLSVADLGRDHADTPFRGIPDCWKPGRGREERARSRYLVAFNPSAYLLALEELLSGAGVKLLYDTRFCTVRREGSRISHVIVENKSGRSAIACRVAVDATGDADVCAAAGEETDSLDSNVLTGWFYTLAAGKLNQHQLSNRYSPLATTADAEGPFFRGDDADDVTGHIMQTRVKIRARLAELRAEAPSDDVQVLMPPAMACFRMTRRLVARFSLAAHHVHRWFDDTIGLTGDWRAPGPVYAIPLGSLRAVGTDNLLAAGRCISAANNAWDVLRAIPPCAVTGEAAGTAAALAARLTGGSVATLDFALLRERLLAQGVLLDANLVTSARE